MHIYWFFVIFLEENIQLKVDWEEKSYYNYYPSDEGNFSDDYGFNKCYSDEDYIEKVINLIEIINDTNKCIVDEETPY